MGRHLEYGIGRGIDDPLAGFQLLLAVIPNHIRAGIGLVAQYTPAGLLLKFRQHLLRESIREGGQGLRRDHARNFPMANGGVLAHGGLGQPGIGPLGLLGFWQIVHAVDAADSGL